MKFIMEYHEWQIHQSEKDGHFEAWKTWAEKITKRGNDTSKEGRDLKRIVLLAQTLEEALTELRLRTSKRPVTRKIDDPNQLKIE